MQSDVWLTPPFIIDALGPFDLDPCAAPEPRPWQTANRHITLPVDGLGATWDSRVWLNPPYGGPNVVGPWMRKMAMHNYGTALIFARTETDLFIETVWRAATAIVFLFGRLFFHRADGIRACNNSGAPSCLIAYGIEDAYRLKEAVRRNRLNGYYIDLDQHCGDDNTLIRAGIITRRMK
jgi:hypothetical protein